MKKLLVDINTYFEKRSEQTELSKAINNIVKAGFYFQVDDEVNVRDVFNAGSYEFYRVFPSISENVDRVFIDLYSGKLVAFDAIAYDKNDDLPLIRFIYNDYYHCFVAKFMTYNYEKMEPLKSVSEISNGLYNACCDISKITFDGVVGFESLNIEDENNPVLVVSAEHIKEHNEIVKKILLYEMIGHELFPSVAFDDVTLTNIKVGLTNVELPYIEEIGFIYKDKEYQFDRKNEFFYQKGSTIMHNNLEGQAHILYLIKNATERFIDGYDMSIIDNELYKNETYSKVVTKITEAFHEYFEDNRVVFSEYDEDPVLIVKDEELEIKDPNTLEMYVTPIDSNIDIDSIIELVKKHRERPTINLRKWLEFAEDLLTNQISENNLSEYESFIVESNKLEVIDKKHPLFKETINNIANTVNTYKNETKFKASTAKLLSLLNEYDSHNDKYEFREVIYDEYNELNEGAKEFIEEEYSKFLEKVTIEDFIEEDFNDIRRVFIHKNAKKQYEDLSKNVKEAIKEIVVKMKTLPAKDLLDYFVRSLCMNTPYDHRNYKIRVKNIQPYRICFWKGKDISERDECRNDLFIYWFVVDHDLDEKKMKEKTPDKYVENDFELFITTGGELKRTIPELTTFQYHKANMSKGPVVTYGCAGSGKTLISFDQYWNIAMTSGNTEVDPNEVCYITFQKLLKNTAESVLKDAYEVKPNCFTLIEYFKRVANVNLERKTVGETDFLNWFKDYYSIHNQKLEKRIDHIKYIKDKPDVARLVYTYYRGLYKGHPSLYNSLNYALTKEEFIKALKDEGEDYLSDNEINNIYDVCKAYYTKKCKPENLYDDNDWAIEAIKALNGNRAKRTKNIIIDEVQDLTGLQLRVVLKSLTPSSHNIFFYGDPHQTVNPTIFNDSVLNDAVYAVFGKNVRLNDEEQLNDIHRTNEGLREYLIHLQEVRKEALGSYMDKYALVNSKTKEGVTIDDRWASYVINSPLEEEILKAAQNSASMIIVPDEQTKEELIKKYPALQSNYLFTIYESKGMEWDRVVLYNLLSHAKTYFDDMLENRGQHSTICRMFFNKYYVACTRARDTFIVIENDIDDLIQEKILSLLTPLTSKEQMSYYFNGKASFEEWFMEAKKLLINEQDAASKYAISQAINLATTQEEKNRVNNLVRLQKRDENSYEENYKFALDCLNNNDYETALLYFSTTKQWDYYNLTRIILDKPIKKQTHLNQFLESDLINKYPVAYEHIINQPLFRKMLKATYDRLIKKGLK